MGAGERSRPPLLLLLLLIQLAAGLADKWGGNLPSFVVDPTPADPALDESASACPESHVVRACLLSDRPEMLAAVVHSVLASAAPDTCIQWEIFTSESENAIPLLSAEPLLTPSSRHSLHVTTLMEAEAALEERGITPVWLRPAFQRAVTGHPRRTLWSLRESASEADPKHSHPLNLLRFYLSELPRLQGDARVLLFDDDVCIRHDVLSLYQTDMGHGSDAAAELDAPLLAASCQMQQYDQGAGTFDIRNGEYQYADTRFLGTIGGKNGYALCSEADDDNDDTDCDDAEGTARRACAPAALEPKLTQLHAEISGRPTFRNETAWNFGVALIHLQRWRETAMGGRMERWFVANEHFAFFAPNSLSFGLGVAYLALAGRVQCLPEQTVFDGLGYLNWDDLEANDLGEVHLQVRLRPYMPDTSTPGPTPLHRYRTGTGPSASPPLSYSSVAERNTSCHGCAGSDRTTLLRGQEANTVGPGGLLRE